MSYAYLTNLELDEALELYLGKLQEQTIPVQAEELPVVEAFGRITCEAVYATISSPHYNACAMDGIALSAVSTYGATETTPVTLEECVDFVRIDTGDPLPPQYDCVVMIEEVLEQGGGKIRLISPATPWQHVRQIGEDICCGEMLLPGNTRIEPAAIGAMLAGGVLRVKVRKRLVAGIIPTGDEIVRPQSLPKPGEIIEFNSSIFSAMFESWGVIPRVYGIVPDRLELIREAVVKAAAECDFIILNAGSSAGREDYSHKAIAEAGEVFVHGIAIRPGKPAILGIVNGKPVIGVPGYPVSGIIVMEKLIKRVLEYMNAVKVIDYPDTNAVLSRKLVSSLKYREFVRVKLGLVGEKLIATPLNRGAGVVTSFVKADGILEVPLNTEGIEAGSTVKVQLLKNEDEIRKTLVLTGSHDTLIDVVTDMMRRNYHGAYLSSSHVGSLGGLMAVKRREAHLAGIHLLEGATGGYNLSYIEKYLGAGNSYLIRCVKRIQGLMLKQGNPRGIESLKDLSRSDSGGPESGRGACCIRYVNRQKGSGTRLLLDYLLQKEGLPAEGINGYNREEFTHMSVAALVASNSADAGMGVLSAARAYSLEFIPVCEEQYDFVLPREFLGHRGVQILIEILKSAEFRQVLERLGGYNCDGAGEVFPV